MDGTDPINGSVGLSLRLFSAAIDLMRPVRSNATYHARYAPSPLAPVTDLQATVLVIAAACATTLTTPGAGVSRYCIQENWTSSQREVAQGVR